MDKFTCEIELGNEAMQDADDVATALETIAQRLRDGTQQGKVMDENGNSVGRFNLQYGRTLD